MAAIPPFCVTWVSICPLYLLNGGLTNHHLKGVKGVDNSHERYTKRGMTAVPLLSGGLFKNRESYCVNEFGYGNVYVNNSNAIIAKLEQLRS